MLSSHQQMHNSSHHASSSSASSSSVQPAALTFTSTDSSGHNFSSPFGDLHLIPPELQEAFVRQISNTGASSGYGAAQQQHPLQHLQQSHQMGSVDTANVFRMPIAAKGVALAEDVSVEDEEEDDDDDGGGGEGGAANSGEDVEEDENEDEGDHTGAATKGKGASKTIAKGNKHTTAAPESVPLRRSPKSSSSASTSAATAAGKTAAVSAKGKGAIPSSEATSKPSTTAKGRAAAASKAAAAAQAAASSTGTSAASGAAATKKKSPSEVKGERDSLTGRRKIKIQFIEDDSRRHITFSKRKAGIMKKAYELSVLTGTQVLLLIVSQTGLVFTFTTPKLRPVVMEAEGRELIQRCLSAPDDEDADEEEDLAEAYGVGEASDEDDEDELMSMPRSPPMSPSKGPVAILRPGPTMTASGGTPKRSGGGTGDGGAAGRRSRAATMSSATVRQQKNSIGSPEHAVPGLTLPATPVTPSAAASAATPTTAANRMKKRKRTLNGGSATPGAPGLTAASTTTSPSSLMQPPASAALLASLSSSRSATLPLRQPQVPQRLQHQQRVQTPNSAPPHFQSLPGDFQPPPHMHQYGGQYHDGSKHDSDSGGSSSFLMGPNGGMGVGAEGVGGQGHNPADFLFSPVDLSSNRSLQQMQQQHIAAFNGGSNTTLYPSGSSNNPSPNATMHIHTDVSSGSSSAGPGTGSSAGYSPAMNGNVSLFPSFGQVYSSYNGGGGAPQHSISSQGEGGSQQLVKNGGASMSSHPSGATLYSPTMGQNAPLHHSQQLQHQRQQMQHHHQQMMSSHSSGSSHQQQQQQQQLQHQISQQQTQQQQQQQGSPWGDSMTLPPTPNGGLGLTPQFSSSANGGMSASGSSEFTNSAYWG